MKKLFLIGVIFTLLFEVSGIIHAQVRLLDFSPPPPDTLDYSKIRCIYEQQVLSDTSSNSHKYAKELMILQVGTKVSKYISYISFCSDSIASDDYKKKNNVDVVQAIQSGRYSRGKDRIKLFKYFPKHKNTIYNQAYDSYVYEEDIVTPQWKIEKEKLTVAGYSCLKAIARFCGRNYTAWFTPDIPVSEGPWKFIGLPGLILRVYDDKGEVNFECTQIEKVGWSDPILKSPTGRSTIKVTKEEFYKQLKKYCDNPSGVIANSPRNTSQEAIKTLPRRMYNPIELFE